jgi:hypothetical protein
LKSVTGEILALLDAERKIDFRYLPRDHNPLDIGEEEQRHSPLANLESHLITQSPADMVFTELWKKK